MIEQRGLERNCVPQRVAGAIHLLREKKEQAERAHHDKSRFLAVASHDLRQPIHALGLYVAELRRKISGKEEQHLVGQIERSVDAIATLINSLLDISKLDAGVIVPKKQACDVSEILDRINANFQVLAQAKHIRLVIHPLDGLVNSDPLLLERVLMNLVSNALKYTPPHGTVMVACRRRGNDMLIEVRDNGIGIDPANQSSIFCEYVQLNTPELNAQKGLGLGLYIVDRLVNLLGHKISLRSSPNKGSTFSLRVANEPPAVGMVAMKMEGFSLAGKKLLIIDGDKQVRDTTAALLSSWGCEVTAVRSLKAVQGLLKKGRHWDLLLSDYQLGGTGLDVIQAVRQPSETMPPCILISDRQDSVIRMRNVGQYFLNKPVKPAKLRSLMQFLLENKSGIVR